MIYKSYALEQNIKPITGCKLFLFYGENHGLIKEFKEKIKLEYKNNKTINLFQDDIIKNQNILVNEVVNRSLFDEKKIIFINESTDKILEILKDLVVNIKEERIFIFSNNLDKRSKLRSYFEKSKECGTCACFKDNEITVRKIISERLKEYQGLTPQIINLIAQNTDLNRNEINNEIDKIKSCFDNKKIDVLKLELLLNIKTNEDFNQLKDEALIGNKIKTNRLLADTNFADENTVFYLNIINQRINKLNEIEILKKEGMTTDSIVDKLKPPVFWKDKTVLIEQSKKWNKVKLESALKKTYKTEIQIKSSPSIKKNLLIRNLIVELCSTVNAS